MSKKLDEQGLLLEIYNNLIAMGSPLGPNMVALSALTLTPFGLSLLELTDEESGPWNGDYTEVDLTAAQIKAFFTAPQQLLPSPGANKYYDIRKIVIQLDCGTIAFDTADKFIYLYWGVEFGIFSSFTTNYLYQVSKKFACVMKGAGSRYDVGGDTCVDMQRTNAGEPLMIGSFGADSLVGNGTMKIRIWHQTKDVI